MLNSPSSARLRTISSRSDCRTEDEIDGQRSTWVVLRMPPLLSFLVLCIARAVARVITKAYTFIVKLAPWVIFTAILQRLIKLLIQYLEDALAKPEMHQPRVTKVDGDLAEQLNKLKQNVANLELSNEILKEHQKTLLDEISGMKRCLELLYDQLKQEEMIHSKSVYESKHIESYNLRSPRTSLGRELMDEGFPPSTYSPSNTPSQSPVKLASDCPPENATKWKNPKATIETTIDQFQTKLACLYDGTGAAWLRPPKENDKIVFKFHEPVLLTRFKIGTGHYEYPTNKLSNATVEILPAAATDAKSYIIVGRFDQWGLAEGDVNWESTGPIQSLRISILCSCLNWIIMSELTFDTVQKDNGGKSFTGDNDEFESW